jgi:hypothetical protein
VLQCGTIADISLFIGVLVTPLRGGLAEQGDILQISFVGVNKRCLLFGYQFYKI